MEHEYSETESNNFLNGGDWWSGHDTIQYYRNYYYLGMLYYYKAFNLKYSLISQIKKTAIKTNACNWYLVKSFL